MLTDGYSKLNNNTNVNFNTQQLQQQQIISPPISIVQEEISQGNNEEKAQDIDSGEESSGGGNGLDQQSSSNSGDDCKIYFSDRQPIIKQRQIQPTTITTTSINEPYVFKTLKIINDPLQV